MPMCGSILFYSMHNPNLLTDVNIFSYLDHRAAGPGTAGTISASSVAKNCRHNAFSGQDPRLRAIRSLTAPNTEQYEAKRKCILTQEA